MDPAKARSWDVEAGVGGSKRERAPKCCLSFVVLVVVVPLAKTGPLKKGEKDEDKKKSPVPTQVNKNYKSS